MDYVLLIPGQLAADQSEASQMCYGESKMPTEPSSPHSSPQHANVSSLAVNSLKVFGDKLKKKTAW